MAQEYHMSRKTICKMLVRGSAMPGYVVSKEPSCSVMVPDKETIKSWLEEDKALLANNGTRRSGPIKGS